MIDNAEAVFEWSPITGATEYVIDVATSERALNNGPDIARHCLTSGETSVQINHIPLNGTNLTIRLWSKVSGVWSYQDYAYETESREDPKHHVERTYLIADHLSTPRLGYDDNQTLTWRWASDGFGNQAPNEDPDADGYQTNINIRFPGQYYDSESGLHYNWNRYYDPEMGRYVTSDPIGLFGGINTYRYANANPLNKVDPRGEYAVAVAAVGAAWTAACTIYSYSEALKEYPNGPGSEKYDDKKHCYASCLLNKCTAYLFIPAFVVGLLNEGMGNGDPRDIEANVEGIMASYRGNCMAECKNCNIPYR